jgi:2-C-methyl-D-erythritol 4-phosphate cytidylyltransferase
LVPCAGVGSRAGSALPKQYAPVAGLPLVAHTLAALAAVPRLVATLVVLAPEDVHFEPLALSLPAHRLWTARCGGATRAESVLQGLAALAERGVRAQDWVLVHDAARCLVEPAWVDRLIDACEHDSVGGLLALPLADTLKAEVGGRVVATVARDGKWAAQTPQMFRLGALRSALARALAEGAGVTDEASAIEASGEQPLLVQGDAENLKVTWPGDFALAARLLATRPSLQAVPPASAEVRS